jgi:hypothetical protein
MERFEEKLQELFDADPVVFCYKYTIPTLPKDPGVQVAIGGMTSLTPEQRAQAMHEATVGRPKHTNHLNNPAWDKQKFKKKSKPTTAPSSPPAPVPVRLPLKVGGRLRMKKHG